MKKKWFLKQFRHSRMMNAEVARFMVICTASVCNFVVLAIGITAAGFPSFAKAAPPSDVQRHFGKDFPESKLEGYSEARGECVKGSERVVPCELFLTTWWWRDDNRPQKFIFRVQKKSARIPVGTLF